MLERLGCSIEIVDNGLQAVERALAAAFDVVFMDCQMPEMDGYAAATEIRRHEALEQRPGRIPIVALTAHALEGDREKCLAAGMDDYLTKPLQSVHLRRVLMQWVKPSPLPSSGRAGDIAPATPASPPPPAQTATPKPPAVTIIPSPEPCPAGVAGIYDRAEVLKRCLGDEALMATLLQVFVQQAGEDVTDIQQAISGGDPQKALRAAHRLKGSAANLALERVRQPAFDLEAHIRDQGMPGAEKLAEALQAIVAALEAAVK